MSRCQAWAKDDGDKPRLRFALSKGCGGTGGDDTITDTVGNSDVICTFGGNDTIRAGSGNDTICAGTGADDVDGESGAEPPAPPAPSISTARTDPPQTGTPARAR